MKHYIDENGVVFAVDNGQSSIVKPNWKLMSSADFKKYQESLVDKDTLNKMEASKYLKETDWYVVRKFERGIEIPEEITRKRAESIEILSK